jgi:hypothetical protein
VQQRNKRALQDIWMAETKKDALVALDAFVEIWGVKYDKAVECLIKDRDALLAFYDFSAEHWKHLHTTNVIESSFATVRHRTVRSKGCLSNKTALAMIFKLAEAAEKSWRRLDGHNQLPKVILGVKFADGIELSDRKLKSLPPDPFRHQDSAIALTHRCGLKPGCIKREYVRDELSELVRARCSRMRSPAPVFHINESFAEFARAPQV